MAAVIRQLALWYRQSMELRDPRSKDFFLAGSPLPIILILVTYFAFVTKIGPAFMANRKPFNVDKIVQIYNIFQVFVCGALTVEVWRWYLGPGGKYKSLLCTPVDFSDDPYAVYVMNIGHCYYMVKVSDLLDTVFFVLRKKHKQVTFLHVYHHMGMCAVGYFGTLLVPGGSSVDIVMVNSFVHVIMYSYYFITNKYPEYKTNVWWKKHITQLQLLQFFLLSLRHLYILLPGVSCGYPKWPAYVLCPQFAFITLMFGDFYLKTYK